jgi:hypothetical protein
VKEGEEKRWYTPEEWEAERGDAWSDDAAVYYKRKSRHYWDNDWQVGFYREVKAKPPAERGNTIIVCATEAGCPPSPLKSGEAEGAQPVCSHNRAGTD